MNSRQKGKRGELEAAKVLRDLGFSDVRRSVQYNGQAEDGQPDLVGIPGVHIEVKRNERLNVNEAMDQARRDCNGIGVPIVLHRKNNTSWLVTMDVKDWAELQRFYRYKLEAVEKMLGLKEE